MEDSQESHSPSPSPSDLLGGGKRQRTASTGSDDVLSSGEELDFFIHVDTDDSSCDDYDSDDEEDDSDDDDSPSLQQTDAEGEESLPWSDGQGFVPSLFSFDDTNAGIASACGLNESSSYIDYFHLFMGEDVIDTIATNTNIHFACRNGDTSDTAGTREHWTDTNAAEIHVFLALLISMSVTQMDPMLLWDPSPKFGKYMSHDRFQQLMKYLRLSDRRSENIEDPISKLRPVLTMVKDNFRKMFRPHQNLVVGDSIVQFKERFAFKRRLLGEQYKYGMRVFVLCDSTSGMFIDFTMHATKTSEVAQDDPLGVPAAAAKQLMQQYLDQGHVLYAHSSYTRVGLAQYLHQHKTGFVGFISSKDTSMPEIKKPLNPQCIHLHQYQNMLAVQWRDRRRICFNLLTTVHSGQLKETSQKSKEKKVKKRVNPDAVIDYEQKTKVVQDVMSMTEDMVGNTECIFKESTWYEQVFFHILDLCLLNAYNMMRLKKNINRLSLSSLGKFSHRLVDNLLHHYGTEQPHHDQEVDQAV